MVFFETYTEFLPLLIVVEGKKKKKKKMKGGRKEYCK